MNAGPVIVRELRAEARNPVNYWIRVIAAALLLVPVVFIGLAGGLVAGSKGKEAFVVLTTILFVAAWIIIPVTISDCISRERREGTLGLLFLTPLNARGILLGKSTVNIARSLTVFLAALPVLAIPVLMGGVSAPDILRAALFNGAAMVLAIAASLMASAVSKQRNRALILSLCFSVLFLFIGILLPTAFLLSLPWEFQPLFGAVFQGGSQLWLGRWSKTQPIAVPGTVFVLSFVVLAVVILFCSARLQRSWQDQPLSARQQKVYSLFCSPRFLLRYFTKWKQRKLTRNPVGWLQSYSWSSRLSTWGWCGVIICVESLIVITSSYRLLETFQTLLQTAFFVSIAFSAVNSFQRERQTGALELILVTPIREKELILGRLRGIWEQFLPAFLVLLLSAWFLKDIPLWGAFRSRDEAEFAWFWRTWQYFSIPVVGLYCGLRFRSMLAAWFLTCIYCLMIPALFQLAAIIVGFGIGSMELKGVLPLFSGLFVLGFPFYAWSKTKTLLRDRSFVLNAQ